MWRPILWKEKEKSHTESRPEEITKKHTHKRMQNKKHINHTKA